MVTAALDRGNTVFGLVTFCFLYPFRAQFYITSSSPSPSLAPGSAFYTRNMSSPVRQLQWQSGLDYVYVATESSVSDSINTYITCSYILDECIALWGKPEQVHLLYMEQLYAYDCHLNMSEHSTMSGHRISHTATKVYTCVQHRKIHTVRYTLVQPTICSAGHAKISLREKALSPSLLICTNSHCCRQKRLSSD